MSDSVWPAIRVEGNLDRARVEWVHANGAGAYAASTVAHMHTRRYHGVLVAALDPPRGRHVILSHVDATLRVDGEVSSLGTHQFPGVPPTGGYRLLWHFAQDPVPRWVYRIGGEEFEHTLCLARGANVAVLRYVWNGTRPLILELRPLLALRPFHSLVHEHGAMVQQVELRQNEVTVRPVPSLPRVVFRHRGIFVGSPDWWRRFEYLTEQERGLDFQEDLWTPGVFRIELQPGVPAFLTCGTDTISDRTPEELMRETVESISACDPGPDRPRAVRVLSVAADAFRADLAPVPGVIAGYPWFELRGRSTLIALAGLYLIGGRVEQAKQVLLVLAKHMRDGLVPSRLPDDGAPDEHNAVDASLLLFGVSRRLADAIGASDPFITSTLLPALAGVFGSYLQGTRHGIHVTAEGLLAAGDSATSLTWMHARVNGRPVTSRGGVPVEVQALWTQACDTMAALAPEVGDKELAEAASAARDRARQAFRQRFWCEATQYPYDVVSEQSVGPEAWADAAVRPNAIMALAVDPELFTVDQARAILAVAERELLTPMGLRTLSPRDPQYRGIYGGGIAARDSAYHQGTVWPYLTGSYAKAVRRAYPDDTNRLAAVRGTIESMLDNNLAVGQVAEIADGDAPHRPNGCVADAANVAELLRALVEDLGV